MLPLTPAEQEDSEEEEEDGEEEEEEGEQPVQGGGLADLLRPEQLAMLSHFFK